ncbi:CMRF35-like molecule 7 isoform X2 [Ochotona curzoniae]|uniref:CMRF35-like molecule 7 isoform X2 n=1 Tax=Ochotona curzoniae TaxID=130825 RepID=UPI001B34C0CC|nr:CMRF35-like molecule 7 isoform X2 [Ochotona curzoniae]
MQLLPALLLFGLPGYCFIRGPRTVTGGKQESTIVRCHYSPGLETYNKWWCRGRIWTFCRVLVQTSGTEQEVTRDRVSIRDNQKDRVFTVTMKGLRRDDAGAYWCGIEKLGVDHGAQVKVNVDPGSSNTATSSNSPARPSNTGMSLGSQRWTHYVLLVFVKVPILLILVSVVLWLRGSRRVPEEQWILVAPGNAPFPRSANDVGP